MTPLVVDRLPELHDPVAVVAFTGWNDAASAATDAARFIVQRLGGRQFAHLDAEPFYDFTESRPNVRIDRLGKRSLEWPRNEFFYARNPIGPHDVVVGIGDEPNLSWRIFTSCYLDVFQQLNVGMVVSLGALLADVPHTRPTRVTGTALDPEVASRLALTTSRYEGPTGIVGILHDLLRRQSLPAASLWANVPHYITTNQNPRATEALLTRLEEVLGLKLDLRELQSAGERFVNEVDTAIAANPEIGAYVRRLEENADDPSQSEEPLPAAEEIVFDIEDFLRRQRDAD